MRNAQPLFPGAEKGPKKGHFEIWMEYRSRPGRFWTGGWEPATPASGEGPTPKGVSKDGIGYSNEDAQTFQTWEEAEAFLPLIRKKHHGDTTWNPTITWVEDSDEGE